MVVPSSLSQSAFSCLQVKYYEVTEDELERQRTDFK